MMRTPIGLLVLASVVALALPAQGQETPPPPEPSPARDALPGDATPAAPEVKPNLPGDQPAVAWTEAEIAAAKAVCAKALAGVRLDYEPLPPIREGICGAPAPILVTSIGGVAISPPATMRCGLAVKLDGWLKTRVQPKAKAMLGGTVVKIRNATSYSCRNRYGGANTRISEHALANALDISEFVLASGERVTVLKSWPRVVPPPQPEPHPEEVAGETNGAIVPVSNRTQAAMTTAAAGPEAINAKPSSNPFVPPAKVEAASSVDPRTNPFVAPVSVSAAPPPMAPPVAKPPVAMPAEPSTESSAEERTAFVRGAHGDACKFFGTVLGPEANEAHKDHFHLDMKPRRHSNFCE